MPTLVRLVTVIALLAGTVFAIMLALVSLVEPRRHEVVIDLPLEQLQAPPPTGQPMTRPKP